MSIIFDLIILLIMTVTVISAYKKGFVASLLSVLSSIVSGIATFIFYKPVASFINDNYVSKKVTDIIRDNISDMTSNGDVEVLIRDMPESFREFLSNFGISAEGIQQSFSESGLTANKFADDLSVRLASDISYLISCAVAVIAIFVVASIVCAILSYFINSIFKLPVLNFANKALGIAMGVISALILGWILSVSCSVVIDALGSLYPHSFDKEMLDNSYVIRLFSSINPLSLIKK